MALTTNPALRSWAVAVTRSSPSTFGTTTVLMPVETISFTVDPGAMLEPWDGFEPITFPSGTLPELRCSTSVSKPFLRSSAFASGTDKPATFGTATVPGPRLTVIVTVEPFSTSSPPVGSCSITSPSGMSLSIRSVVTSNSADCSSIVAAVSCSPVTSGTVTMSGRVRKYASAPPASSSTISAAISHQRRERSSRPAIAPSSTGVSGRASASSSAAAISAADANRWAGSLASARRTIASSAGLTFGLIELGTGGSSPTCFIAIATALSPSKGTRPQSISKRITPIE